MPTTHQKTREERIAQLAAFAATLTNGREKQTLADLAKYGSARAFYDYGRHTSFKGIETDDVRFLKKLAADGIVAHAIQADEDLHLAFLETQDARGCGYTVEAR